jgi:hypothetical protein
MTRDVVIGTVTGVSAVIAMTVWSPRPGSGAPLQSPPPVREVAGYVSPMGEALGGSFLPTTRPDPVRARLERLRLERVEVKGMRLDKLLAWFAEATGVNFYVDWRGLEAAGINGDMAVTLNLHDVAASAALNAALHDAGGGNILLAYRVEEGVVHVSTADVLAHDVSTRVYDVRDLIEERMAQGGGGVGVQEAGDALARLVTETIAPTVWRVSGGTGGDVRPLGGRLVVTLSPELHEQLAEFLAALRRTGRGAK